MAARPGAMGRGGPRGCADCDDPARPPAWPVPRRPWPTRPCSWLLDGAELLTAQDG